MARRNKPILFQGDLNKNDYFEGWYFKQVTADESEMICFIPGISLNKNDRHCFVQTFFVSKDKQNQSHVKTDYFRYPVDQFIARDKPFQVQVGANIFTEDEVSIYLWNDHTKITGSFSLGKLLPIERSLYQPSIMGPFSYLSFMECYHGIISMNHPVKGALKINQHAVDLDNGKGYIEKDWGTSFPKKYLWLQCNHFEDVQTSLFFSAADIPFKKTSFEGFICNLVVHDREYRFATYKHSQLDIKEVSSQRVKLTVANKQVELTIEAHPAHFGELTAPREGEMNHQIKEGFSDFFLITLKDYRRNFFYSTVGKMGGIEIVGYETKK